MAANDPIVGTIKFVAEDAQNGQRDIQSGLDAGLLKTTTANLVPYLMFPGAYRFFQPPAGTQVFAAEKLVIPSQGYLIIKVRPRTASQQIDSIGSTGGFVKVAVLEQDLSQPKKDPITRILSEVDRNTTRVPDDVTWPNSTAIFNDAYAFQPGNGRAWLLAGPQNIDLRTAA